MFVQADSQNSCVSFEDQVFNKLISVACTFHRFMRKVHWLAFALLVKLVSGQKFSALSLDQMMRYQIDWNAEESEEASSIV